MVFKFFLSVGFVALLSRILGFIRDLLSAVLIGVSRETDIFYIALQLPNSFRALLAEGALQNSAIPILSRFKNKKTRGSVATGLLILMVFIGIGVVIPTEIFMPTIMQWLAPGYKFDSSLIEFGTFMARIMFPYLIFISIATIFISLMNLYGKFFWSTLNLLFFNIVFIALLILGYYFHWSISHRLILLSFGILGIGVLQNLWVIAGLFYYNISLHKPSFKNFIKLFFQQFLPNVLTGMIGQLNVLFNSLMATLVISGGVSYLYYANRLYLFPVGLIGYAITTVIIPLFSKEPTKKHQHVGLMNKSIMIVWALAFPATIGLVVLSYDIVTAIIGYGKLTFHDQRIIAYVLSIQSLALPALLWSKIFSSYLISTFKVKTNFILTLMNFAIHVGLLLLLLPYFHIYAIPMASVVSAWVLFLAFSGLGVIKQWLIIKSQDILFFFLILLAGLMMLGCIEIMHYFFLAHIQENTSNFVLKLSKLGIEFFLGLGVYSGMMYILFKKRYKKYWNNYS